MNMMIYLPAFPPYSLCLCVFFFVCCLKCVVAVWNVPPTDAHNTHFTVVCRQPFHLSDIRNWHIGDNVLLRKWWLHHKQHWTNILWACIMLIWANEDMACCLMLDNGNFIGLMQKYQKWVVGCVWSINLCGSSLRLLRYIPMYIWIEA